MHWRYGVVETENWLTIQRPEMRSYLTVPSPSLFVWQPPPKPDQSVFVGTGP
jgi:hypothetical protein